MLAVLLTPPGRGALAVIHVAGDGARALVGRLFSGRIDDTLRPGRLVDRGEAVDEVMVRAVEGFSAEETVEITSHGGPAVVDRIFAALGLPRTHPRLLLERGIATGRLDRLQADAWALLPEARTERAALMLQAQAQGALSAAIRALRGPEDVDRLLATAVAGIALASPRRVVLAGPPNAGKSSLFNALVERDRALVSPVPGTTRDPVRELIAIDGLPVELVDTAGVDAPRGPIEAVALDRTWAAVAAADLVLVVHDLETGTRVGFDGPALVVANKADLGLPSPWPDALPVSAKTGQGLDDLRRRIVQALGVERFPGEGAAVVFTREQERLLRSSAPLKAVKDSLLR
jgi:tRNA modification GTPase